MQKRVPIISNSLVRAGSDGRNKNAEMFKTKEPKFNIVDYVWQKFIKDIFSRGPCLLYLEYRAWEYKHSLNS